MNRALPLLFALATACAAGTTTETVDNRILVTGNDMGPRAQDVTLSRGSAAVTNALVTVNGTLLTETVTGHYAGQLPVFLGVGDTIRVRVQSGADVIVGMAVVPPVPTLLSPRGGTAIHIQTPLDFSWLDTADPDAFQAAIQYNGVAEIAGFIGSARSGIVVTSRIPLSATNLTAYLYTYNDGTFTGPAHPSSRMHVRQSGGVVSLVMGQ